MQYGLDEPQIKINNVKDGFSPKRSLEKKLKQDHLIGFQCTKINMEKSLVLFSVM